MKRAPFQNLGGDRGRVQFIDPLTGRRDDFYGTHAQCLAKVEQIRGLRGQLKLGHTPDELRARQPMSHDRRTLDDLWKIFARRATRPSLRTYENHWTVRIAPCLGKVCPWELTAELLYEWTARLAERYAPNTVKATAELVLMVAKLAGLHVRPWEGYHLRHAEPKRQRRSLANEAELVAVVLAARNEDEARWTRGEYAYLSVAVLVLGLTGLRSAELAGLSWRDLVIEEDQIPVMVVARQAPRYWHLGRDGKPNGKTEPDSLPKGRRARTQRLHPQAAEALRAHREDLRRLGMYHPRGPVFPDERGFWRRSGEVLKAEQVARLVTAAGLPYENFTVHEFRHTFVSLTTLRALEQGRDFKEIQQLAGHADPKTTLGYVQRLGPGLAVPPIGRLKLQVLPAITAKTPINPLDSPAEAEPNALILRAGHLAATCKKDLRALAAKVNDKKRPLRDVARDFLLVPAESRAVMPDEVRDLCRAAYQRAYRRASGRGKSKPACRTAGKRGANALMTAWSRVLRRETERSRALPPASDPKA